MKTVIEYTHLMGKGSATFKKVFNRTTNDLWYEIKIPRSGYLVEMRIFTDRDQAEKVFLELMKGGAYE